MKIYEEEEEEEPQPLKTVENRKWFRMKCDINIQCSAGQEQWPGKIVDFSQDGLGIVSPKTLSKGDLINFSDQLDVAEVVWAEDNRAGLKIIK